MSVLSPLRRDMNPEASTIKTLSSIQEQLKWYAVIIIVIYQKCIKISLTIRITDEFRKQPDYIRNRFPNMNRRLEHINNLMPL